MEIENYEAHADSVDLKRDAIAIDGPRETVRCEGPVFSQCPRCWGAGWRAPDGVGGCERCQGTGKVRVADRQGGC